MYVPCALGIANDDYSHGPVRTVALPFEDADELCEGGQAFAQAVAGVFAEAIVQLAGEGEGGFAFVFDGFEEHFRRNPGLFENVFAGANVNALFEF